MFNLPRDTYAAIFLIVLTNSLLYTTLYIESPPLAVVGSEVWPRVILVPLTILSIFLLIRSIGEERRERLPSRTVLVSWFAYYRRPLVILVLYFLFLVSVPYLGMLISGLLFAFFGMLYLGTRNSVAAMLYASISFVAVGGMWMAFIYWLGVILPRGAWTGI